MKNSRLTLLTLFYIIILIKCIILILLTILVLKFLVNFFETFINILLEGIQSLMQALALNCL